MTMGFRGAQDRTLLKWEGLEKAKTNNVYFDRTYIGIIGHTEVRVKLRASTVPTKKYLITLIPLEGSVLSHIYRFYNYSIHHTIHQIYGMVGLDSPYIQFRPYTIDDERNVPSTKPWKMYPEQLEKL